VSLENPVWWVLIGYRCFYQLEKIYISVCHYHYRRGVDSAILLCLERFLGTISLYENRRLSSK